MRSSAKANDRNLIVGFDVGTSKVSAVVGEITPDQQISIVGVGHHVSHGMDKGGVNDLNLVIGSVQNAINEAELMADCRISSVYIAISGKHISCQNESGMVTIHDSEVPAEDVENVIQAAKAVPMAAERKMLQVMQQAFAVAMQ